MKAHGVEWEKLDAGKKRQYEERAASQCVQIPWCAGFKGHDCDNLDTLYQSELFTSTRVQKPGAPAYHDVAKLSDMSPLDAVYVVGPLACACCHAALVSGLVASNEDLTCVDTESAEVNVDAEKLEVNANSPWTLLFPLKPKAFSFEDVLTVKTSTNIYYPTGMSWQVQYIVCTDDDMRHLSEALINSLAQLQSQTERSTCKQLILREVRARASLSHRW
eukprot:6441647-Amphidinium_carterae.1